jgi:hypothetical protein
MPTYTVELTETEDLAFSHVALSTSEWINNAAHERARVAIDDIVKVAVARFLEQGKDIPGSKDAIVKAAFDNGWVGPATPA